VTGTATRPVAEIVTTQAALEALADEWADLVARSPHATPFQAHAWITAWARAYCPVGRMRVVVVRDEGRLVAAAPLHLVRRGPWRVLSPLGAELSDCTDVLVADEPGAAGARDTLTAAVLALPGWRLVDLPEVRPDAGALAWAAQWPGRVVRSTGSMCLELPALPVDELIARLNRKGRARMRNHLRRTDATRLITRIVEPADVADGVDRMLRLHEEQWRDRGVTPEHLRPRFRAFLREAAARMAADGQAVLVAHALGDRVEAAELLVMGRDFLGSYLSGVSPDLRRRIDVSSFLVRADLNIALERGLPRFSLMRGVEPYKLRWLPDQVPNARLLLLRPGLLGGAGLPALVRGRAAVAAYAKERGSWLLTLRTRLARLRRS
jgi:CelD/BcsL family acetyltransferase involved in cellulose biosynthesis